jgi:ribulose-bisphosphate carboxylase large chain
MAVEQDSFYPSGERFTVLYRLTGSEAEARAKAEDICIEQTVEFPAELIHDEMIRQHVFGRIESFQAIEPGHYEASISFAIETSGFELTQLVNVIFGNISLKPGIRVEQVFLPDGLLQTFRGPRFGREGWRARLNIPDRPLLSTALKPMGLSPAALAEQAYQMALGGIDLIKDDHGLANQPFAPYQERVERCVAAIERANRETGYRCVYAPNISAAPPTLFERAYLAKQAGAGAVMVAPGLVGLGAMRQLADDDQLALPILSHPTVQGSFVTSPGQGIAHGVLFGLLVRLAGGDGTIFPNYGGRFAFSRAECAEIAQATAAPLGQLKPIFPAPGGGMTLARIPDILDLYGREVILLIGGGLHQRSPNLAENCRYFRTLVETM